MHFEDGGRLGGLVVCALLSGLLAGGPPAALGEPLGSGQLQVAGLRLAVSPESQTVPFNTPTIVETTLEGFDPAAGELPPGLRVLGDLSGPEIAGFLPLETVPGEPFRIPRLTLKGEYRLDNIRLLAGEELLAYAAPRSAAVRVTQVLVTRVTSRPLTLEEIQSRGIALDEDSFRAFNFTFGFAVDGEVVDYNLPVIFNPVGPGDPLRLIADQPTLGGSRGTLVEKFRPPQLAPFTLELEPEGSSSSAAPSGGCDQVGGCRVDDRVSLPGVILFPTDVSLLHQHFSVVLFAKNDAPDGDPLVIRDLTAKVVLPPGLRQARTEPPTPLGVPIPVRTPGADGELGTVDDVRFLVAQATGQVETLTEGLEEGTHIVEFHLEGVLDGLPGGRVRRLTGRARGAVLVRDASLGLTITHPEVVASDEEYSLLLTVSNTSNAPVNLLTLTLPASRLAGVEVVGSSSQTLPTLAPAESEVVEFRLRSLRGGRVVASSVRSGSAVDPVFELAVGVGDAGIPHSPTSIILPRATETLPDELKRHALGLVGLGFSLATAPPSLLDTTLPRIGRASIDQKVYWLAQAGRHRKLGEQAFDALAVLAAEWSGAREPDWEWDELRRGTRRGGQLAAAFADVFAAEAAASSARAASERFAAATAFLGAPRLALADGAGARLEVVSRASGKRLAGDGLDPERLRELPFAELYDLGAGELALLAAPEPAGYRLRLTRPDGGSAGLRVLLPDTTGGLRALAWSGVALAAAGSAELVLEDAAGTPQLAVDSDGDGVFEGSLAPAVSTLAPRPFAALAAVQNADADPSGHVLEVLFSRDVDLGSLLPADPQRFVVPGKISNGGLVEVEKDLASFYQQVADNPFAGLRNTRIVRVVFNNPLSPYVAHDLTVDGVGASDGSTVHATLPVVTTVTAPGTLVEGTVFGPDGRPAPFARVDLYESDLCYYCLLSQCKRHRTAAVQADAAGRFAFDYVRQTACSDVYTIEARDPASGKHGSATGRVRFIGQTVELDVLMLGRGTIEGRVTYEDGSVPASLRVLASSPVFAEGREAVIGDDGAYRVGDVPVGTVTLAATDGDGSFTFQTVEIPTAGAVVARDLLIVRRAPDTATGDVRATVVESDGATPVYDAYVALYVDGDLMGVERSDAEGGADFGTVPAGRAEIEAFDGETGRRGAQVFFDVDPDQVNAVTLPLRDDRGAVEGRVFRQGVDGAVTPLAGAVVWVGGTPFNTTTDASGAYRLDDVFAGDRKVLAADLERQEQTSAQVTVNGDGSTVYRDLYFVDDLAGSGIAGEVLDYIGNPVAGAFVHISAGADRWYREAFTDASGRFVLPDLGVGSYTLFAYRGADGVAQRVSIRFEGETPFARMQFKKGTIRGTVRAVDEDGQTVGVRSLLTYRTTVVQNGVIGLDWEPRTLETADDGSFELRDVLAGPYQVTVSNAFHGEKTLRGELVYHGEVVERDVLFERNGTIRGTVLDWDGATPVAGASVRLRHPSFSSYELMTDAAGSFVFELVPPVAGRFPIEVEVEQGAVFRQARVWVRFDKFGQELDVDVALPEQGTVSGRVEDASGYPVPGAAVTLREASYPHRTLYGNADGEGRFSFTNVFAGRISLSAKAPSLGGLGGRTRVDLGEEDGEVYGLISLEPTGEIVGRVISPVDGEPVPSAAVTLYRWGSGRFDRVTADSGGAFRFRLLPMAMYRVWVFDPTTGRHGALDGLVLETNAQVIEADVALEVRGEVDGHLREPAAGGAGAGAGVPGATIKLRTDSQVDLTTYSSTDVDGYFEFLGIPEGSFTLSTREPAGRRRASGAGEIVDEGERVTVDLELEASGRVSGSVWAPPGAPPGLFTPVNVLIEQDGQVIGASLDNPFVFDGVINERPFTLSAREVGGDHRAVGGGELTGGEGEEIVVDLTMVPIGSAEVTVVDSVGDPVAGADVRLTNTGFYPTQRPSASTGADGKAFFAGLGEGRVSAYATHPVSGLKGSAAGELTLDGEVVALSVQLEDSGVVRGRVLLSDGVSPAFEALVTLERGAKTLRAQADETGAFEFSSVPLGGFELYVQERFGPGVAQAAGTLAANGEAIDLGDLVLDDYDPFVTSLAPATGARDVPLAQAVTITFNEPLDAARYSSSWIRFRKLSGGSVAFSAAFADGDRTLILTPSAGLASFKGYEVTVQQAYDLAGRSLFDKVRTVFYTVDVVPPTVLEVSPRDGEKQVPIASGVRVTFSEPITFESISGASFELFDLTAGQGVGTTWVLEPGERQVLLTPVGGLDTDREYRLTVQGVADGSGNVMSAPVVTTFWSLDTVPPSIDDVVFPAGTAFTAGDDVPLTVLASDLHGVDRVEATLGGWSFADGAEPWELSLIAPVVAAVETRSVEIIVTDVHGNAAVTTRDLEISPLANGVAPEVETACVRDGEAVVPGFDAELRLYASDDLDLESLSFSIDGVELERIAPVHLPDEEAVFLWRPPADAQPGDVFVARLEARDFAGNVGAAQYTLEVPVGTLLVGPRSLFDVYAGEKLVIAGGTFLLRETLAADGLTVLRGAGLEIAETATGDPGLGVAGLLRLQCGTAVAVGPSAAGELSIAADARLDALVEAEAAVVGLEPAATLVAPAVDAGDLYLRAGARLETLALAADAATVEAAATIVPLAGSELEVAVGGLLRVEAGGTIDVSYLGYPGGVEGAPTGGAPPGVVGAGVDYGGSHGGRGERWYQAGPPGEVYDSVYYPQLPGGGGSGDGDGKPGGGVLRVAAGTLELEGQLRASGNAACFGSAGAGGSVQIDAGTVRGAGSVDAIGGRHTGCAANDDGAGGGGRIALRAAALDGFDPERQLRAQGGHVDQDVYAAPGTALLELPGSVYGTLILARGEDEAGNDLPAPPTGLPALGSGAIAATEADGADLWVSTAGGFLTRWHGAFMTLLDGAGSELGSFRVAALDGHPGRARLAGAAAVAGAASYRGEYRFDEIRLIDGARYTATDPLHRDRMVFDGEVLLTDTVVADEVRILAGAVVKPASGSELRFEVSGTLTVEAGATVSVYGLGYAGGTHQHFEGWAPPGVQGSGPKYGGSHGGRGTRWDGAGPVGEVYDSVYFPRLPGGGGSHNGDDRYENTGSPGGGVIAIEAGALVLDGTLDAGGSKGCFLSAGAGGTVAVDVGTLSGAGEIKAIGGRHPDCFGGSGSGGGGRIAIHAGALDGFDPALQAKARGGQREGAGGWGGTGTVYLMTPAHAYGELRLDLESLAGGEPVAVTVLPSIGKGVVGTATPAGADLWIEPADPAKLHSLGAEGMWVRVGGVDYRVLAEAADRRGLLLEGAAGAVAVGDDYLGIYKFDRVHVAGGARLRLEDGAEVGEWIVDPDSTLELYDLDPPALAITEPADGATVGAGQSFLVTADASDASGVTQLTARWNGDELVDAEAPYEWTLLAPEVGESTALTLEVEALDAEANAATETITLTVEPALALPAVSAVPLTVVETHSGTITSRLSLVLDQPWETALAVDYALADGSALAGEDYAADAGTVTFAPGETVRWVVIGVHGDTQLEGDETFSVELTAHPGVEVATPTTPITVLDDDGAHCFGPELVANGGAEEPLVGGEIPGWTEVVGSSWGYWTDASRAHEGSSYFFAGNLATGELAQEVDLSAYAQIIDAGAAPLLYTGYSFSWNHSTPDSTRTVLEALAADGSVLATVDTGLESSTAGWRQNTALAFAPAGTRGVRIRLISQRSSVGSQNDGYHDAISLRLLDAPHVTIGDAAVGETDAGTTLAAVPVSRTCGLDQPLSVDVSTADATALAGADYQATTATLTLAAGEASGTIDVAVYGDELIEGDESFTVSITGTDPAVFVHPQAVASVTVVDDDTLADSCTTSNLLVNGDAEAELVDDEVVGWTEVTGSYWTRRSGGTVPHEGTWYLYPGSIHFAELRQDVDVSAFASRIDGASQQFEFSGYVRSANQSPADRPRILVEYRDASNQTVLGSYDSGYKDARAAWLRLEDFRFAPAGTRWIRVRLLADRNSGSQNNAYFDDLRLVAHAVPHVRVTPTAFDEALAPLAGSVEVGVFCHDDSPITVGVGVAAGGSAVEGEDFTLDTAEIALGGGVASAAVDLTVLHDHLVEGDESFALELTPSDPAVLAVGTGPVTVVDDDSVATSCATPSLLVNGGAEEPLVDGELPGWLDVAGGEWTARSTTTPPQEGTYYFYAGLVPFAELQQDVDVSAFAAQIDAASQQFYFSGYVRSYNQSNPDLPRIIVEYRDAANQGVLASYDSGYLDARSGWTLLDYLETAPAGTRWIRVRLLADRNAGSGNDGYFDGLQLKPLSFPELSIADAAGAEDAGELVFAVASSCASSAAITVDYATAAGSASEGEDYVATAGTLTLAAGETAGSIAVPLVADALVEGDESFTLELSAADHARLADASAVGTIVDDDAAAASRSEEREGERGACAPGAALAAERARAHATRTLEGDHRLDAARLEGERVVLGAGTFVAGEPLRPESLTLLAGARLTAPAGRTLAVHAERTLRVGCGAAIDHGAGALASLDLRPASPDAGGSHGGLGTPSSGLAAERPEVAGESFDSLFEPSLGGGSGALGAAGPGRPGGGAIVLTARRIVLDGEVAARGADAAQGRAAGAGGSVWLEARRLAGGGRIDVAGGSARACSEAETSGAGGGGRVALRTERAAAPGARDGFDPRAGIDAGGGAVALCDGSPLRFAGPGTVYLRLGRVSGEPGLGELLVRQPGNDGPPSARLPVAATPLPKLGRGVVGAVEAAPAGGESERAGDLWIEPADPDRRFDLGLWGMRLRAAGGEFEVIDQSPDRRRLLLAGAAGRVAPGDAFEGVYRFDRIVVEGGARLEIGDAWESGALEIEDGSEVIAP